MQDHAGHQEGVAEIREGREEGQPRRQCGAQVRRGGDGRHQLHLPWAGGSGGSVGISGNINVPFNNYCSHLQASEGLDEEAASLRNDLDEKQNTINSLQQYIESSDQRIAELKETIQELQQNNCFWGIK